MEPTYLMAAAANTGESSVGGTLLLLLLLAFGFYAVCDAVTKGNKPKSYDLNGTLRERG